MCKSKLIQKTIIMKRILPGIILVIAFFSGRMIAPAQNAADTTGPGVTAMQFICYSTSDDSLLLSTNISVKRESGQMKLANAPVTFYSVEPNGDVKIGESKTDVHGTAVFKIPVRNSYARNEQEMFSFKAVFAGTEKFEASEGEFGLKPAKLKVSFYEEDSVRYVKVEGFQYNANGTETPITEGTVLVSVPKLFSNLKVAEITLDSTGMGTAEFPRDIIGDSLGNLTVIASIEENDVFGNIKGSADNKWGLEKHLISPDRPSRELWTPIAPLWMIITLIIMLLGVWGHYTYAVIQLVGIKKASKSAESKK
jgi:hypothetical protein